MEVGLHYTGGHEVFDYCNILIILDEEKNGYVVRDRLLFAL